MTNAVTRALSPEIARCELSYIDRQPIDFRRAAKQHDEYERCMRLLVHDLGELSYMIEQYCQDPALLQRCDELVNHHAETLRLSAAH